AIDLVGRHQFGAKWTGAEMVVPAEHQINSIRAAIFELPPSRLIAEFKQWRASIGLKEDNQPPREIAEYQEQFGREQILEQFEIHFKASAAERYRRQSGLADIRDKLRTNTLPIWLALPGLSPERLPGDQAAELLPGDGTDDRIDWRGGKARLRLD